MATVPDIHAASGATWVATTATNWHGIVPFGTSLALTWHNPSGIAAGTSGRACCLAIATGAIGQASICIVDATQGLIAFTVAAPASRGVYRLVVTLTDASGAELDVLTTSAFGAMP